MLGNDPTQLADFCDESGWSQYGLDASAVIEGVII